LKKYKAEFKGTALQKVCWLKSSTNQYNHFSIWPLGILLKISKNPLSLNCKKTAFSGLRQKVWLINIHGCPLQIADSGKPIIL
jgi:hypothetical protein